MFSFKSVPVLAAGVLLAFLAKPAMAGSILLGGIEDYSGSNSYEGTGDYNDLIFQMSGNISVLSPSGQFYGLNQGVVDETGTVFWDQHSKDGLDYNLGYCATGTGTCHVSSLPSGQLDYLATQGNAAPLSVLFQASGAITINLLFELSSVKDYNTVGWYDPAHPEILHQIFAGADGVGASTTFMPTAIFALYSTNGTGALFGSVTGDNQQTSLSVQHFAMLQVAQAPIPEPGTISLAGAALAACLFGRRYAMLKTR